MEGDRLSIYKKTKNLFCQSLLLEEQVFLRWTELLMNDIDLKL